MVVVRVDRGELPSVDTPSHHLRSWAGWASGIRCQEEGRDSQEGRTKALLCEEHQDLQRLPDDQAPHPAGRLDEEDVLVVPKRIYNQSQDNIWRMSSHNGSASLPADVPMMNE